MADFCWTKQSLMYSQGGYRVFDILLLGQSIGVISTLKYTSPEMCFGLSQKHIFSDAGHSLQFSVDITPMSHTTTLKLNNSHDVSCKNFYGHQ